MGVVEDSSRIVLVLERRESLRVRRVVLPVRDVRRVRAVDVVHCRSSSARGPESARARESERLTVLLEERPRLVLLDRVPHALDELDSLSVRDRARDRAVVLDVVQRVAGIERAVVRRAARNSRLAATKDVPIRIANAVASSRERMEECARSTHIMMNQETSVLFPGP